MAPTEAADEEVTPLQVLYEEPAFRMFCMKVLPCSKHHTHDWTQCPFAHPQERARRRDPRLFNYTGVACPSMKQKGACELGVHCPYSHHTFEYWLHPSRYCTQLCSDGTKCARKLCCFFAHSIHELRTPDTKPWVAPEAVVAAAAAAATARNRQSASAGAAALPASPGAPGAAACAEVPETEEEEQRRVVDTVTWLVASRHFSAEQAAVLLRQLLPPGALDSLQSELRKGGTAATWRAGAGAASSPVCHSDPLGYHQLGGLTYHAAADRLSMDVMAAPPLPAAAGTSPASPHPMLVAAGAAASLPSQLPQQGSEQAATAAARLLQVTVAAEACRSLGANPLAAAAALQLSPGARLSVDALTAARMGYTPAQPLRTSLNAQLEAQLCSGYAGYAATLAQPPPLPPSPQSLAPQDDQYLLHASTWPAAAAPSAAAVARASLEAGLAARLSVDSMRSVESSRHSMDSSVSVLSHAGRWSQDLARLSQDFGSRLSLDAGQTRMVPPPTASAFASSLFASTAPPLPGGWQPRPQRDA